MNSSYLKRALDHKDPRFANVLRKLGHKVESEVVVAQEQEEQPDDKPQLLEKKANVKYRRRDLRAED